MIGHSLGGAIASLLALDFVRAGFTVDLVTLGAPMVGSAAFGDALRRACDPATPFVNNKPVRSPPTAAHDPDASHANHTGNNSAELSSSPSSSSLQSPPPRLPTPATPVTPATTASRGLLRCFRLANALDMVPRIMSSLKGYVHYPANPIQLDSSSAVVRSHCSSVSIRSYLVLLTR